MTTINERSSAFLTVSFFDDAGDAVTPAKVLYRIDDVTNASAVRAWTEVTPAQSVRITITAADTAIISRQNPGELRKVTVKAIFGQGGQDQMHSEQEFTVKRMQFVS